MIDNDLFDPEHFDTIFGELCLHIAENEYNLDSYSVTMEVKSREISSHKEWKRWTYQTAKIFEK